MARVRDGGGMRRREPRLDDGPDAAQDGELRAHPEDRPGRRPARSVRDGRREPSFTSREAERRPRRGEIDLGEDRRGSGRRGGSGGFGGGSGGGPLRVGRRRRGLAGRLAYWCLILGVWGAIGGAGVVAYEASRLPPIDQIAVPKRPPNIAIQGDDGTPLANRGETGGAAIRLGDLPPYLPRAFVAIEDRRFYKHWGVDPAGIARAVLANALHRGGVQGGSTLTQQLAKNVFLTQERTLSRKIQEAILAVWLEHKYTKDQILELYLNRVYFGSGAYGVEAAALHYFGHGAAKVSVAEAALLAGLMKAPTKLAPNRNPGGAVDRAAQVVAAMRDEGYITPAAASDALAHPAHAVKARGNGDANYAADYVMEQLDDTVGAVDEDIVVTTTISPSMEAAGERAIVDTLSKGGAKYGVSQGALVSVAPDGAIKALIGGRDYADSQFDRAVAAKRQPGSSFKPFVYLSALEAGLTPDTVREDGPITIHGWHPENYSREYFGPVTLTKALSLSLNTVAVRLGVEVGPKAVVATAHRMGVASELQPNASIALGTSEVSPLELTAAYAPFANGGIAVQPHIITKVRTTAGKVLYQRRNTALGRAVDPVHVGMMNAMMQETLLTGTARKAELPGWQAAGKTGTSQDWRDAWFVGYTAKLVTGVWFGNDDGTPTKKASGGNLPVDAWSRYMKAALRGQAPAPLPGTWRPPAAPAEDGSPLASLLDRTKALLSGETGNAAPPAPRGGPGPDTTGSIASAAGAAGADDPRYADEPMPDSAVPEAPPAPPVPPRRDAVSHGDRGLLDRLLGG